jgi:hypothetical protein
VCVCVCVCVCDNEREREQGREERMCVCVCEGGRGHSTYDELSKVPHPIEALEHTFERLDLPEVPSVRSHGESVTGGDGRGGGGS